ncbi:hypothetical protein BRC81_09040 [Halobacteriales archaeon QS_1_68_20]|nr:MAG: hypothetical protein BRC81_09040 [Halobacteriales archaeon QS_1_68_20]
MSYHRTDRRERAVRIGGVVVGSTLALAMSFFGVIALVSGDAAGAFDRLPLYVLAMAASFVAGLVTLDDYALSGETVLRWATALAVGTFLFVGLGSEGIVYSIRYPGEVLSSKLFVYVVSAGLMATGIGFWVAKYRGEVGLGSDNRL